MCFVFREIWKSEKLKFDYLKNEKIFRGEVKNIHKRSLLDIKNRLAKIKRTQPSSSGQKPV